MQKTRESRILEELGKNNNQTFTELRKSTKMGTESLVLGLKELEKKGITKQDKESKRYAIITDIKDKKLQGIKKYDDILNSNLDEYMNNLANSEEPFECGYVLLRAVSFCLPKLTMEQHSPNLSNIEKHEYQKLIKKCNDTVETIFETLGRIDLDQTIALKKALDVSGSYPDFEFKMSGLANKRQRNKGQKIASKIIREMNKK